MKLEIMKIFERLCHLFGVLPLKFKNAKLQKAIKFCELDVTPQQVYSLAITLPLILISLGIFLTNFLPSSIIGIYIILCLFLSYYLFTYPITLQRSLGIKLSSETVTATIYMATALRETPNLERAVLFAASNLSGPLGEDLRKIVWKVYEGKYLSMDEALADYSLKWKDVNNEFVSALNILRNYLRKGALEEAVSIITGGTKEKMKDYALDLRGPVAVIDVLGFTFPLLAMTVAPIFLLAFPLPEATLIFASVYGIFLPLILYWLIKFYLGKRPWTFPIVDISEHPKYIPEGKLKIKKFLIPALPLSLTIGFLVALPGILYLLFPRPYSFTNVLYSLSIVWGIAIAMVLYFYSYKYNLKIIDEVRTTETEFTDALYTLGDKLAVGTPLETSLEKTAKSLSQLSISKFFEKTVYNIKTFGMTLENALFDPTAGSVRYYPSKKIKCVMKVLSDAVKKSVITASQVALWVQRHMKLMHEVEQDMKDVTEETTSSITIQCYLLAPLTCGVIVAFASFVMVIMVTLGAYVEVLIGGLTGTGGDIATGMFTLFQNVDKLISPEYFQLIVGVYMIEIIYLLSMFQSKLENGEDKHSQNLLASKYIFISCLFYTITLVLLVFIFSEFTPITGLL